MVIVQIERLQQDILKVQRPGKLKSYIILPPGGR